MLDLAGVLRRCLPADTEALQQKFYKLSEELYKQAGGAQGAEGQGTVNDDGTINTDFDNNKN